MSILLNAETTFIVQGITGREAVNLTRECLDYGKGAKVVGGVTPGRLGREVHGVPVFDTVAQAVEHHGSPIDGSVVTVPPAFTKDAVLEALDNGIKLIVIVTERIPRADVAQMVERANETGARIIVPTGALLGLDAVRAAAEGDVASVTIETRKPPRGLEGAPYLVENGIDVLGITTATLVFKGNAFDAARGFPANVNVAAALALAGIGPERTMVEIWGDPGVTRNTHTIRVEAASARLTMTIENVPSEENPRTGKITPLSILACLRGLTSTLKVGS